MPTQTSFRLRNNDGVFDLRRGVWRLGSSPRSDVVLVEAGVSREHALLHVTDCEVLVEDCGSRNGTWIDGTRVSRAVLAAGSVLSLGPARLVLEAPDSGEIELAVVGGATVYQQPVPHTIELAEPSQEQLRTRWFDVVAEAAARLPRGPRSVLQALVAPLELGGAAWCAATGVSVELRAAVGSFSPDILRELARIRPEPLWLGDIAGTPVAAFATTRRTRLLVLCGDFAGRDACLELLRAAFELLRWSELEPIEGPEPGADVDGPQGRNGGDAIGLLSLPQGFVPGSSPASRTLLETLARLADFDLPVLLLGETGVGKELIAQTLHASSNRRRGPFVPINCAAVPGDLLEAELFGIGHGVATGVRGRRGKFEEASGGTLFLDEVGELPLDLQPKLLRALQEREIEQIGGRRTSTDVRIITATNVDLEAAMARGAFRPDLYYRIAAATVTIPPLRERREDLAGLLTAFLERTLRATGKPVRGISKSAFEVMSRYHWPGNVRQLYAEVRRLVALCPAGGAIEASMLPAEMLEHSDPGTSTLVRGLTQATDLRLETVERLAVHEALRRCGGNHRRAAELLGISRSAVTRRLQAYGCLEADNGLEPADAIEDEG